MVQKSKEELFRISWRKSDFYPWVMGILDEEINATYVKEIVMQAAQTGNVLDSSEIGDLMKTEVQASLRVKSVREQLE